VFFDDIIAEKCKVMHLAFNNPKVNYVMDATQLQVVSEKRDLGIIVSDLKWENRCTGGTAAVKQANKIRNDKA